jgi:hypothetical protein
LSEPVRVNDPHVLVAIFLIPGTFGSRRSQMAPNLTSANTAVLIKQIFTNCTHIKEIQGVHWTTISK